MHAILCTRAILCAISGKLKLQILLLIKHNKRKLILVVRILFNVNKSLFCYTKKEKHIYVIILTHECILSKIGKCIVWLI